MSEVRSYYGRPILKEPVWKPEIPLYFFTGGLAGASAVMGLAARAAGNEPLAKAGTYLSFAGDVVSPALLVADLGRPERFLNMLRVFKVTSPMSVGSWILAASGATSTAAAACEVLGILPRAKVAAETMSAILGAPLATYTATLISDTAVPVWHEARRELPFVFAGGAAASAGGAVAALTPAAAAGPARRLAIVGGALELAATKAMEDGLGELVGEPYRKGVAGRLNVAAKAASLGGAALLASGGRRSRLAAAVGSLLVLGGELALRWSVFEAGFESARDPKYVVASQRERLGAHAAA